MPLRVPLFFRGAGLAALRTAALCDTLVAAVNGTIAAAASRSSLALQSPAGARWATFFAAVALTSERSLDAVIESLGGARESVRVAALENATGVSIVDSWSAFSVRAQGARARARAAAATVSITTVSIDVFPPAGVKLTDADAFYALVSAGAQSFAATANASTFGFAWAAQTGEASAPIVGFIERADAFLATPQPSPVAGAPTVTGEPLSALLMAVIVIVAIAAVLVQAFVTRRCLLGRPLVVARSAEKDAPPQAPAPPTSPRVKSPRAPSARSLRIRSPRNEDNFFRDAEDTFVAASQQQEESRPTPKTASVSASAPSPLVIRLPDSDAAVGSRSPQSASPSTLDWRYAPF